MSILSLPWAEICVALPLFGAGVVGFLRTPIVAGRWTLGVSLVVFGCSFLPWAALSEGVPGGTWFAVDGLTAPLLPLVALLHLLTVLATSRVKLNRMSLGGHLAAEGVLLGTFAAAPSAPWVLVLFLALGTLQPFFELRRRGNPSRVYVLHMAVFVGLLACGWVAVEVGATAPGAVLLALAVLIRSGTVPAHLWVADLFDHASFGTALLYVIPLVGVHATLRLVLPVAPEWILDGIGDVSLLTAVYAAGMAAVENDARRFFAYLFLSHASLVLIGLELHTTISLTGALCLWVSVALSLGGLGLTLRAIEARYGLLSLSSYRGLYDQSPALAVGFLVTGLGSVGFPGTLGFVAAELLEDGAIAAEPFIGVWLVLVAALNGIAVLRAYFRLFTGTRHAAPIVFGITPRERLALFVLSTLLLGGGLIPQALVASRFRSAETLLRGRAASTGAEWPADAHAEH